MNSDNINNINQQFNERLFPSKNVVVCAKLIALFMFGTGIYLIIKYHYLKPHIDIISILLFILFFILFFICPTQVLIADTMYVSEKERYFLIKNRKISFDEIANINYHYGFLNPIKYPLYGVKFDIHLKSDEVISFNVFYRGSEIATISELKKLGLWNN